MAQDNPKDYQTNQSGFELYVPRESNSFYASSVKLASSISARIKPDYSVAPELKSRDKGVYILDKTTVPAVLIECGYLDNETDMKYLQDPAQQEIISRDILSGIQKYQH